MNELTRDKFLSEDELLVLRQNLEASKSSSPRDTLLLELLLCTGARNSELLALRPADLNIKASSIYIRGTKKSKDREIPIPRALMYRLQAVRVDGRGRFFPFGYDNVRRIWLKFSPGKPLHCLRHTAAVLLYKKTRDIKLVQLFLGHRSMTNTAIYTNFVYSQETLRAALYESEDPAL